MNRGGGGNEGKTWWPFATMPERAETQEAIGLNRSRLRSTRPNAYTRGQIHLFLEAERLYGFNDIVDWMKYGTDDRLVGDDLRRVRTVDLPRTATRPATNSPAFSPAPPVAPNVLLLRGVLWASGSQEQPLAIINNRTLGVNEEGKVRVGKTNLTIRCLAIQQDSVRIRIVGSGEERELRLKTAPQ
jgi:hypothetical protein